MRRAGGTRCTVANAVLVNAVRRRSQFSLETLGVFPSRRSALGALRRACERSATPWPLVDTLMEQLRRAEDHRSESVKGGGLRVKSVRVYAPPPPAAGTGDMMLLFRGTPETGVEEQLQNNRERPLYFSSSLQLALTFGALDNTKNAEDEVSTHRVMVCRVERLPGRRLFNRAVAAEDELRLLDGVGGDLDRLNAAMAQQTHVEAGEMFDGFVDWLDDGAAYTFDAAHTRMHTLLCIDVKM